MADDVAKAEARRRQLFGGTAGPRWLLSRCRERMPPLLLMQLLLRVVLVVADVRLHVEHEGQKYNLPADSFLLSTRRDNPVIGVVAPILGGIGWVEGRKGFRSVGD